MLKETIDRMRFDMDEMRNNAATSAAQGSGQNSAANTLSKSLGAELIGKMSGEEWEKIQDKPFGTEERDDDEAKGNDASTFADEVVANLNGDGEETEGEDVVQTIITRKKRASSRQFILDCNF